MEPQKKKTWQKTKMSEMLKTTKTVLKPLYTKSSASALPSHSQ